ncbi:EPIDERMAL PATTERNING FACTOR-like protein 6 [Andrographis paniculata]|uniref:EPIDERMAL PATTERNING FACTOR-like protein 6 n=1 Tax=Andrographis paniculata TaxID=175694 RepID=UPI0021E739CB|nr:EPIDERMAL PATTERNING FACTOR-like protein 6 [Andrographis paniculata]
MMARIYCFLVMILSILCLLVLRVSSRHFASPNYGVSANNQGKLARTHSVFTSHSKPTSKKEMDEEEYKVLEKIAGSKPPKCKDKCYGCKPCEAIQVPTTNSHVGVQYTNYEPEGWKCKCGHTFFTP